MGNGQETRKEWTEAGIPRRCDVVQIGKNFVMPEANINMWELGWNVTSNGKFDPLA